MSNKTFFFYWNKHTYFEPVPTVIDRLIVVSHFGHASNLLYLLHQPDAIDPESSSRALYWAARQGHCACVILLLQEPGCDAVLSEKEPCAFSDCK